MKKANCFLWLWTDCHKNCRKCPECLKLNSLKCRQIVLLYIKIKNFGNHGLLMGFQWCMWLAPASPPLRLQKLLISSNEIPNVAMGHVALLDPDLDLIVGPGKRREVRSVSTTRVHGPSSRAENSARKLGCTFWHPSTPVSYTHLTLPTIYSV